MRHRIQSWLKALIPLAFLTAGLFSTFHPTLMSGFSKLQTDPGDSRSLNYRLEHIYRWVTNDPDHASLWDPPIFYPARNVLSYSDTLLTLAPIYWAWRSFGYSPEVSFSLWMISLCTLNYLLAMMLLYRGIGADWLGAAFGAYLIAFANSRIAQLGHQALLSHAFVLLAIYGLVTIFGPVTIEERPASEPSRMKKRAWIIGFFLVFAAQFYAGFYTGYFLFLVTLFASVWAVCLKRFRRSFLELLHAEWRVVACGLLLAIILLAPLAYHYLLTARDLGFFSGGKRGLAHLSSFIWMGGENLLYGWTANLNIFNIRLFDIPMQNEQKWGLGLVTTLVMVWLFWQYRGRLWVHLMLLVTVTTIIAFTYFPGKIYLWKVWYYTLPGIRGIRVMARIFMLLAIPAGIALAVFITCYRKHEWKFALAIVVALICCLEQVRSPHFYDRDLYQRRVQTVVQHLNDDCEAFFLSELYPKKPQWVSQLDSVWASLVSGVPSITGYSGKFPHNDAIRDPAIFEPS
ncbi:MAG: hypothetical protein RBS57_11825, partial [Desulforhabdus sp.]|nr:hypothetical protein [Desulforhabdus sp.]